MELAHSNCSDQRIIALAFPAGLLGRHCQGLAMSLASFENTTKKHAMNPLQQQQTERTSPRLADACLVYAQSCFGCAARASIEYCYYWSGCCLHSLSAAAGRSYVSLMSCSCYLWDDLGRRLGCDCQHCDCWSCQKRSRTSRGSDQ